MKKADVLLQVFVDASSKPCCIPEGAELRGTGNYGDRVTLGEWAIQDTGTRTTVMFDPTVRSMKQCCANFASFTSLAYRTALLDN